MKMDFKSRGTLNILALSGVVASLFYVAHVVAGRIVWSNYNPLAQPISDLTATSAISQELASMILYGYDFFNLLFCLVLLVYFRQVTKLNRTFYAGLVLKAVAEVLSTVGYKLFPLADTDWTSSFQNNMHYAITGVVVLSYIVLAPLLTTGLAKTRKSPAMTRFMGLFSIVFITSGLLTVIVANIYPEYVGLVERVNLYSLMVSNMALALWVFNHKENPKSVTD
ncbi:MAG TPA: hypothetical protein DDZ66_04660 [Firmicutes bacterium]|nr:hypothetical protein [Bacillota bacterium]